VREDKQPKDSLSNPTGRRLPNLDGGERKESVFIKGFPIGNTVLIKDGSGPEIQLFRNPPSIKAAKPGTSTPFLYPKPPSA
jgi:hypothetical protein